MDEWIDGLRDTLKNIYGWMDREIDGRVDGWTEGRKGGWIEK